MVFLVEVECHERELATRNNLERMNQEVVSKP